jgi:hypothetical protein
MMIEKSGGLWFVSNPAAFNHLPMQRNRDGARPAGVGTESQRCNALGRRGFIGPSLHR